MTRGEHTRVRVTAKYLDASSVLRVQHSDVLHRHVRDDVRLSGVLAKTAHGDTVRAVAPHVLDEDVGAVRLECWGVVREWSFGIGGSERSRHVQTQSSSLFTRESSIVTKEER